VRQVLAALDPLRPRNDADTRHLPEVAAQVFLDVPLPGAHSDRRGARAADDRDGLRRTGGLIREREREGRACGPARAGLADLELAELPSSRERLASGNPC